MRCKSRRAAAVDADLTSNEQTDCKLYNRAAAFAATVANPQMETLCLARSALADRLKSEGRRYRRCSRKVPSLSLPLAQRERERALARWARGRARCSSSRSRTSAAAARAPRSLNCCDFILTRLPPPLPSSDTPFPLPHGWGVPWLQYRKMQIYEMYLLHMFRQFHEWYLYLSILRIQKMQPLKYLYLKIHSSQPCPSLSLLLAGGGGANCAYL